MELHEVMLLFKSNQEKDLIFGSSLKFNSKQLAVILKLGLYGAIHHPIDITSRELGQHLGVSQQTAARYLVDLEKNHLIERTRTSRGQSVKITKIGRELLENLGIMITKALFSDQHSVIIQGKIESGLGEGAWYISQEEYLRQFNEIFGFKPYPGTLNIRMLTVDDLKKVAQVRQSEPYIIHGFTKKDRKFGDVLSYRVNFQDGTIGALIIPSRTHHEKDIIELVAPVNLRKQLADDGEPPLRDGTTIKFEVLLHK
ncbi:MAG: DUF120 domain-containing protein [Candidatus Heimdallarchaeota archaeon]|nr:DUF120 domain-containing protein [Candidatus Heimdallarchaeota archaeon]